MADLHEFLATGHNVIIPNLCEIEKQRFGKDILQIFLHLTHESAQLRPLENQDQMTVPVYQFGSYFYYKDLIYEYGPEIFGYRNPDLSNYVKAFGARTHDLKRIFESEFIAEKEHEVSANLAFDYTRTYSKGGLIKSLTLENPEDLSAANLFRSFLRTQSDRFLKHKGLWFRLSKSFLVQICYINALLMRYQLPIVPVFLVVSQRAEGGWSDPRNTQFYQPTHILSGKAIQRIKQKEQMKGNYLITDAEIRMAYKLIYEHSSPYMRKAARATVFFLEKHYGYNEPEPSLGYSRLGGYVPVEFQGTSIQPSIQYHILDPEVIFADFSDRPRKRDRPSYQARLAVDMPDWVRQQTIILNKVYET